MVNYILFYSSDLGPASRAYAWAHGGHDYSSPQQILGILSQQADTSGKFGRIEIMDHGSSGYAQIGGTANNPRRSSIATANGTITHDPGMLSFWRSMRHHTATTSGIVLNMCNVGKGNTGRILLKEIRRQTGGIVYGATKPMTTDVGGHHFNDRSKYRRVPG